MELYVGQTLVDESIAWLRERGWRIVGVQTHDLRPQRQQYSSRLSVRERVLEGCRMKGNTHIPLVNIEIPGRKID